MPSAPVPKRWKAASGFTYRHVHYAKGDPVTDRRTIAAHANGRVIPDRTKTATAETSEPEPEDT